MLHAQGKSYYYLEIGYKLKNRRYLRLVLHLSLKNILFFRKKLDILVNEVH